MHLWSVSVLLITIVVHARSTCVGRDGKIVRLIKYFCGRRLYEGGMWGVWSWINILMSMIIDSYFPSAAYMRQWFGSALAQIMTCRLFGAKPLPEPKLVYCQWDSWHQISVKFESEFYHFHSRECIWKCRLPEWWTVCPGWYALNSTIYGQLSRAHVTTSLYSAVASPRDG